MAYPRRTRDEHFSNAEGPKRILALDGGGLRGILTVGILKRIEDGGGTEEDLDTLVSLTNQMVGTTICVLSDSVAAPVQSSIQKFRSEYMALIRRNVAAGVA